MLMKLVCLNLKQDPRDFMGAGDVGYIISGIKNSAEVKGRRYNNPC